MNIFKQKQKKTSEQPDHLQVVRRSDVLQNKTLPNDGLRRLTTCKVVRCAARRKSRP